MKNTEIIIGIAIGFFVLTKIKSKNLSGINGINKFYPNIKVEVTKEMSKEVKKILSVLDKEEGLFAKQRKLGKFGEMDLDELDELPRSWKGKDTTEARKILKQLDKITDQLFALRNTITPKEYDEYIEHITMYDSDEWFENY